MSWGSAYYEYIQNGNKRITIGMPGPGKTMTLSWEGTDETLRFSGRKACLKWLVKACPDSHVYAFSDGVTLCAGSVRGLAERAGIKVPA